MAQSFKEAFMQSVGENKILREASEQLFHALAHIADCEKTKLCPDCRRLAADALHDYWNRIEAPKAQAALLYYLRTSDYGKCCRE